MKLSKTTKQFGENLKKLREPAKRSLHRCHNKKVRLDEFLESIETYINLNDIEKNLPDNLVELSGYKSDSHKDELILLYLENFFTVLRKIKKEENKR